MKLSNFINIVYVGLSVVVTSCAHSHSYKKGMFAPPPVEINETSILPNVDAVADTGCGGRDNHNYEEYCYYITLYCVSMPLLVLASWYGTEKIMKSVIRCIWGSQHNHNNWVVGTREKIRKLFGIRQDPLGGNGDTNLPGSVENPLLGPVVL